MKLYKLTNAKNETFNNTIWGAGVTHSVKEKISSPKLCSEFVVHAYKDPDLALLLDPIHGWFCSPVLWEAEGEIAVEDWGKVGCYELTTIKIMPMPEWYEDKGRRKTVQALFAVLCAKAVLKNCENKFLEDTAWGEDIRAVRKFLQEIPDRDAAQAAGDSSWIYAGEAGRAAWIAWIRGIPLDLAAIAKKAIKDAQ